MHITTEVVSSNPARDYVYSIQQYVNKFVNDLLLVGGFLPDTPVSPTKKSDHHNITDILLNVALNAITHTPLHFTVTLGHLTKSKPNALKLIWNIQEFAMFTGSLRHDLLYIHQRLIPFDVLS